MIGVNGVWQRGGISYGAWRRIKGVLGYFKTAKRVFLKEVTEVIT